MQPYIFIIQNLTGSS